MLSFQGSLTEHWEMFVNERLGLILDLHPCKTALQRLGWLKFGAWLPLKVHHFANGLELSMQP